MKKSLFAIFAMSIFFVRCAQEHTVEKDDDSSASSGMAQVNEDGYLTFPSLESLQQCLEEIGSDIESGQSVVDRYLDKGATRSGNRRVFNSIAAQEKKLLTRSEYNDDDDDEEMTPEEFELARASELLYEDSFMYIMDTTLRVIAGDNLYQITEYGTFASPLDKMNLLPETIENFEQISHNMTQLDEDEFLLSNGITYANTFQQFEITDITHEFADDESTTPDCVIYKINWDETLSLPNNVLTRAGDNDEQVEGEDWGTDFNYFSSTRRMRSKLYRVNYLVGKYIGYKCKYQKRKKFLGIKYWVKTNASKMEIAINYMELNMKLSLPAYANPGDTPFGSAAFGAFSDYVSGTAYSAIVRNVGGEVPYLKGWAKELIGITAGNFTDKIPAPALEQVYKIPEAQVKKMFKGFVNKRLDPLKRAVTPQDQRTALFGWGQAKVVRVFTTGTRSWDNIDKKNITFANEGGLSLSLSGKGWGLSPMSSIKSTMKKCDITASVTAGGVTKSIRVIKD
jgi:hypothetical protein